VRQAGRLSLDSEYSRYEAIAAMLGVPACSMIPRVDAGKLTFAVEGSSRSEMTASDPKRTLLRCYLLGFPDRDRCLRARGGLPFEYLDAYAGS
jgi:hypothetical protein